MNAVKSVLLLSLFLLCIPAGGAFAHSVPGPGTDKHNTVYSYNISEVSLDSNKKLHVTVTVHMCPACSPYNNYVKVTVGGIGTQTTTNTPVGTDDDRFPQRRHLMDRQSHRQLRQFVPHCPHHAA